MRKSRKMFLTFRRTSMPRRTSPEVGWRSPIWTSQTWDSTLVAWQMARIRSRARELFGWTRLRAGTVSKKDSCQPLNLYSREGGSWPKEFLFFSAGSQVKMALEIWKKNSRIQNSDCSIKPAHYNIPNGGTIMNVACRKDHQRRESSTANPRSFRGIRI